MLKNMKIGKRLVISFLIAILLSSIAGVTGIALLKKSDSDYSSVLENYGFAQGELGNLGRHLEASRVLDLYVVTAEDESTRSAYRKELEAEDADADRYMVQVKARLGSELGQQVYAELETALKDFRNTREDVFKTVDGKWTPSANLAIYRDKMSAVSETIKKTLNTMIEDKTRIGNEKSEALTSQIVFFQVLMVGILIVAFIFALLLSYVTARGISRPIAQLELAAKEMVKGNYDVLITSDSHDEIGSLAGSMREMMSTTKAIILDTERGLGEIENGNFDITPQAEYVGVFGGIETALVGIITGLSGTIAQIGQSSDQVSSGSDQVSSGAQSLSQGATQQASSVEELAATISDISQQVKGNADHAVSAREKAETAGTEVTESNWKMQELIAAMSEISRSSQEIGKVIKTIEDIAFQTNILALNAAVEAARAGAAGKGFAVVADEVRNLASKSAEAAKGTTELIEGAMTAVSKGTRLVDETAKSLNSVVERNNEVTVLVNKIAAASGEQADSIVQVTLGMDQISSVVQTNSATAEESAAASEELYGQAQMLKQLVSKFKLNSRVQENLAAESN